MGSSRTVVWAACLFMLTTPSVSRLCVLLVLNNNTSLFLCQSPLRNLMENRKNPPLPFLPLGDYTESPLSRRLQGKDACNKLSIFLFFPSSRTYPKNQYRLSEQHKLSAPQ